MDIIESMIDVLINNNLEFIESGKLKSFTLDNGDTIECNSRDGAIITTVIEKE